MIENQSEKVSKTVEMILFLQSASEKQVICEGCLRGYTFITDFTKVSAISLKFYWIKTNKKKEGTTR